jgi:uncharacterized membrane protein YsdA (DUF1294 family)
MISPAAAAAGYAGLSFLTLALYALDKRAARAGRPRVRERTLHGLTLAGGFPGALAGQWLLRHKTRHASFVLGAWLALLAHAAAWGWWCWR